MKNTESTSHSIKWNAINSIVSQGTTIITGIVLMRLLDPNAFGLIGMITVFIGFINKIRDSGLSSSLIYQTDLEQTDKDTVFWFNVMTGTLFFVAFFFSAAYIADFYDEPQLTTLVEVFSFTFLISAISNIHGTLLKKQLAFKKIFQVEVTGLLVSAILAIISAFMGFGVWSLIVLNLSKAIIHTINLYIFNNYFPSLKFSYSILKKHMGYSLPVLGTQSFNYWTRNADNFFIGRLLGASALGFYSRAYFFVSMPTQKISNVIGRILFPSLSLIKGDKKKAADLLLKSMKMTAFITFPLLGGLIIFTEPFIMSLFGKDWLPMATALKILSVLSLFQSVTTFINSIFYSQGATKLNFKLSLLYGIFNIIIFYIGSLYSIEMVAMLLLLVYFMYLFPRLYYSSKLINIKIIDYLNNLKVIFLINCTSMLASFILYFVVLKGLNSQISLIAGILFYVLIYAFLNFIFNKTDTFLFKGHLKRVIKAK